VIYLRAIVALLGGWRAAAFAALAMLALGLAGVQTVRLANAKAHIAGVVAAGAKIAQQGAEATAAASEAARREEQTLADAVNAVDKAYQRGKANAQAAGERVAADLRTGNLKLRAQWRGCEARSVPGAAPGAGQPDDAEQRRADGAGDLVRAAAQWDAKERALQAVIEADRAKP
jgi:hypothetical protein